MTFLVTLAHGEEQYYYGNEIGDAETALDQYPQYHYHGTTNKNGHSGTALDHYHYHDDTRNTWFKTTFYELLFNVNQGSYIEFIYHYSFFEIVVFFEIFEKKTYAFFQKFHTKCSVEERLLAHWW